MVWIEPKINLCVQFKVNLLRIVLSILKYIDTRRLYSFFAQYIIKPTISTLNL